MDATTTISCLLFSVILTSFVHGEVPDNPQTYNKILLQFNKTKNLSEPPKGEEVLEEFKELEPSIIYYLHIEYIPTWVQFLVVQTHVFLHNVTLGYNIVKVDKKYVIGQNIGLVQNNTASGDAKFFLENSNPFNVTVLIAAVAYRNSAPIPGGCNMEFSVETAPWLELNEKGAMVEVLSQPALSPQAWGLTRTCDLHLQYQAYHLYLPERDFSKATYFEFISKMLSPFRISENGRKVERLAGSEMRHMYSAYHGTGTVYAMVALSGTMQSAAYVPALSYACSPAHFTDTCEVLTSTFSRILCALVLFIGLFVCMFGHSFFQTELFIMSTLLGGIISYILITPYGLTDSTNVLLATLGGIIGGNCWLLLFWVSGSPLVSVLMATLTLGFFSSCLLFYTVFADAVYVEYNLSYWLVFASVMLMVAVLAVPIVNQVNILSCCIVGSYAAIVPIDHYIGSNLKYILINVLRRATVPNFDQAIVDPPVQTKDMILVGVWLVLAVIGFILQSQKFASRAPFPPIVQAWRLNPPSPVRVEEERPLLFGRSPGSDSVFS